MKRTQRNVQAVGVSQTLRTGIADSFEIKIEVGEGLNAHRSQHRNTRLGDGYGGPLESKGCGMYIEMQLRT